MSARGFWTAAMLVLAGAGPMLVVVGSVDPNDRIEAGQKKAAQCVVCHGPAGVAINPTFPHLAGQNAAYLGIQLRNFKTGQRYDPLMTPVAESLSDADIDDLAAYYSALQPWHEARDEAP